MLVGMALRQIPTGSTKNVMFCKGFMDGCSYGLPLIWKQALSVAIGVAGQAKLGILHPPATGLSYSFVSPSSNGEYDYSWGTIASVYLADIVVVAMSVLILNLEEASSIRCIGWDLNGEIVVGVVDFFVFIRGGGSLYP